MAAKVSASRVHECATGDSKAVDTRATFGNSASDLQYLFFLNRKHNIAGGRAQNYP
jgi:hypothetical protein